jgi:hypothetical protein
MIIPSHIPNVPKWVVYERGDKIAWLDPYTNAYVDHDVNNVVYRWAGQVEITNHMERYPDILPLTSLGYILSRVNAGYGVPSETIRLYIEDLLKEIRKNG